MAPKKPRKNTKKVSLIEDIVEADHLESSGGESSEPNSQPSANGNNNAIHFCYMTYCHT